MISGIINEIINIFMEMSPYLMLGLFFVGLLHIFFSKELIARQVGKDNFASIFKSTLLGIPLPLCSCGVIPSAVYMKKNGASNGAVVSFLISTPQTGIDSIIATYGMLGPIFAIFRPLAAFIMGLVGGSVIRLTGNIDKKTAVSKGLNDSCDLCELKNLGPIKSKFLIKVYDMFHYAFVEFLDDISLQFAVGILVSGLIAFLIPDNFFAQTGINRGVGGMLIMIIIGIPMYICATASIPIALTLMLKGFSPGVAFVFLAVGPATNAASLTILFNVLGKKTTFIYLGIISIMSMLFGLTLDEIFKITGSNILSHPGMKHYSMISGDLKTILGVVFLILLFLSLLRKILLKIRPSVKKHDGQMKQIKIEGMTCHHCVTNVTGAIRSVKGVEHVQVSLEEKKAFVKGRFKMEDIKKAVKSVGYKVAGK